MQFVSLAVSIKSVLDPETLGSLVSRITPGCRSYHRGQFNCDSAIIHEHIPVNSTTVWRDQPSANPHTEEGNLHMDGGGFHPLIPMIS